MNIKILDSWLRDYVKTKATAQQIAEKLSLSSVSVERIEKFKNDLVYDIEVTTNRPELMSLVGLARETAAVLNQNGIKAEFTPPHISNKILPLLLGEERTTVGRSSPASKAQTGVEKGEVQGEIKGGGKITIKSDPILVNRLCAVVMDVTLKPSPQKIQDRLESTDIRSLNNVIDVTNYVMRVIGHPTHVFDYDRLTEHKLIIRESKKGEVIKTLDDKEYTLPGGDIVADNGKGTIIDLLGIMGLENSVVTNDTKRILFFVNNTEPAHVRKTSMQLGIRTEAAILNEKGIDPELAMDALLYGVELFKELAGAKIVSEIIDIYPNKIRTQTVTVSEEQITRVIGVDVPLEKSAKILESLGFEAQINGTTIVVTPPSFRAKDIAIPEDIIEEIARIYGYHNIPNKLPALASNDKVDLEHNELYWEDRIKDAMKYWGFTETYTYPMVSKNMYDGSPDEAVSIENPLNEDLLYMRRTLAPSLVKVVKENPDHETAKLFEIANVYEKNPSARSGQGLPIQTIKVAGVVKKSKVSFFEVKGVIEQLLTDLEIKNVLWKPMADGNGADIYSSSERSESRSDSSRLRSNNNHLGNIEMLTDNLITFELNFQILLSHATLKKTYKAVSKYPPSIEDLALIAPSHVTIGEIMELIKKQSSLIVDVSLLDKYQDTRTFHVIYQSYEKNLTSEEVGEIREKILKVLRDKLSAKLKD